MSKTLNGAWFALPGSKTHLKAPQQRCLLAKPVKTLKDYELLARHPWGSQESQLIIIIKSLTGGMGRGGGSSTHVEMEDS